MRHLLVTFPYSHTCIYLFNIDVSLPTEWRSGRSGHLPLQDEDVTTETIHGWKKVNTIAHYHVPDGATMALVPSRNKSDLIRHVHGTLYISTIHVHVIYSVILLYSMFVE